ncbi:MAG TPA: hypothetical protein VN549_00885 [Negativicutes bacterium]|nr:hypothetical protein [Negativicutes bacterium]
MNKRFSTQTRIRILLSVVFIVMLAVAAFFLNVTMLEGLDKLEERYVGDLVEREPYTLIQRTEGAAGEIRYTEKLKA